MVRRHGFINYTKGIPNPNMAKIFLNKSEKTLKVAWFCYRDGYPNNSLSRSYYAVYQIIVAILVGNGDYDKDSNTHEKVIGDFNKNYGRNGMFEDYKDFFNSEILKEDRNLDDNKEVLLIKKERITVGSHISVLRLFREESDYDPVEFDPDSAEALLHFADILTKYIKKTFKKSQNYKINFEGILWIW